MNQTAWIRLLLQARRPTTSRATARSLSVCGHWCVGETKILLMDYLTLHFSTHSSMLGPSSRCVDENWGGSPKSKVSFSIGTYLYSDILFWKTVMLFDELVLCLLLCLTQRGGCVKRIPLKSLFAVGGLKRQRTRPPISAKCHIRLIQCQVTLMEILQLSSVWG